jgi:hypothetical protein
MPESLGATVSPTAWDAAPGLAAVPPATPWTIGLPIPIVVGPVYFVYGGASVWILVR